MLDFTKNLNYYLSEKDLRDYKILRLFIFILFLAGGLYLSYIILFPTQTFTFDFNNPNSLKNTITSVNPFLSKGVLTDADTLAFDSSTAEKFSQAKITFILDKKSDQIDNGTLSARKSYLAFFYPEAEKPMGFKEGSLVKNGLDYFIVSGGKLRKFSSPQIVQVLGYNLNTFLTATPDELTFNDRGDDIISAQDYPDGTLFKVNDNYYQLKNQKLSQFVSVKAFATQYVPEQAITKDAGILNRYELSPDFSGFADGTLVAFDISVFVVSGKTAYPIGDPVTFSALGYNWNDVIPIGEDELGLYQKGKIIGPFSAHPNGTILATREGKYYFMENGQKIELRGKEVLQTYFHDNNPILVDEKSLDTQDNCNLEKNVWPLNSYFCTFSIDNLNFPGKDYEFKFKSDSSIQIDQINVTLSRNISWPNLRLTLSVIKQKIFSIYGQSTNQ